jgi:hypothetical protein
MLLSNKYFTPVNAKGDCINNVGSVYFVHVSWIPFVCLDFFCQSRFSHWWKEFANCTPAAEKSDQCSATHFY